MHAQIRQFRNQLDKIDIKLLIFLVLLLNVKLFVKIMAIVMIYILVPHFKLGLSMKNSKLPLLFPLIILIAFINAILYNSFKEPGYWLAFLTGIGFWTACLLLSHQARLFAEGNTQKTERTLAVFFIANALVSFIMLAGIIWETGTLNPYTYQGNYQKYFIGTGDYIKGISFDTSTANAAINAFGVFLFLEKRKWILLLICLCCLLLTGSNLVNLLLLACLVIQFIFRSDRIQKSMIALCILPMIIFWARVSPQNNNYIASAYKKIFQTGHSAQAAVKEIPIIERPDSILNESQKKEKTARLYLDSISKNYQASLNEEVLNTSTIRLAAEDKPLVPVANIHTPEYQHRDDTNETRKEWLKFTAIKNIDAQQVAETKWPGKILAIQETVNYLKKNPSQIITGAGMGNFSSKLAFKSSGLGISGYYPSQYVHINPAFEENHLALYLSFFTNREGMHSVINTPHSVYDQMLGEYGMAGIAGFLILYILFFARNFNYLSYGLPILVMMTGLFFTEYWFEQLSIVFLFELLMFMNIKEASTNA